MSRRQMTGTGAVVSAAILLTVCGTPSLTCADEPFGRPYPIVYGSTGRPYGPTQAHYQYQRRYGRTWTGGAAAIGGAEVGAVNGYPATYGSGFFAGTVTTWPVVPTWGGTVYLPSAPVIVPTYYGPVYGGYGVTPGRDLIGRPPLPSGAFSPAMEQAFRESQQRWREPIPDRDRDSIVGRIIPESTPQAQMAALRKQAEGDRKFQNLEFPAAAERYRSAARTAPDLPDARFRLAVTEAARGRYQEAVKEFRLGLSVDPTWPDHSFHLHEMYGDRNQLPLVTLKQEVTEWVREDIRDPDRLFLLAALLHLDGDDRSQVILDTAIRLAGQQDHLLAFHSAPVALPREAAPRDDEQEVREPQRQPAPPAPMIDVDPQAPGGPFLPPLPTD